MELFKQVGETFYKVGGVSDPKLSVCVNAKSSAIMNVKDTKSGIS